MVTKDNAGKKTKRGGSADAKLANGQNSTTGPAPPLDKEASAIAGQKHEGGEGLGGCGRRELCCRAAGAGKKKSWPSNLRLAVLRAL